MTKIAKEDHLFRKEKIYGVEQNRMFKIAASQLSYCNATGVLPKQWALDFPLNHTFVLNRTTTSASCAMLILI